MNKSELLNAFNNHMADFFEDVLTIFPDDSDIKIAKTTIIGMRKINPKLVIKIWKEYILDKYKSEIDNGDIDFFINKNFSDDLKDTSNSGVILEKIDSLREPIKKMGQDNLTKTIKYIQNLTKLCNMYYL